MIDIFVFIFWGIMEATGLAIILLGGILIAIILIKRIKEELHNVRTHKKKEESNE